MLYSACSLLRVFWLHALAQEAALAAGSLGPQAPHKMHAPADFAKTQVQVRSDRFVIGNLGVTSQFRKPCFKSPFFRSLEKSPANTPIAVVWIHIPPLEVWDTR